MSDFCSKISLLTKRNRDVVSGYAKTLAFESPPNKGNIIVDTKGRSTITFVLITDFMNSSFRWY